VTQFELLACELFASMWGRGRQRRTLLCLLLSVNPEVVQSVLIFSCTPLDEVVSSTQPIALFPCLAQAYSTVGTPDYIGTCRASLPCVHLSSACLLHQFMHVQLRCCAVSYSALFSHSRALVLVSSYSTLPCTSVLLALLIRLYTAVSVCQLSLAAPEVLLKKGYGMECDWW
jgi:hypothetical protein